MVNFTKKELANKYTIPQWVLILLFVSPSHVNIGSRHFQSENMSVFALLMLSVLENTCRRNEIEIFV